ncbi:MAG: hypothetical protein SOR93_19120 [Clostridiales Family XIII bacterium]|uniref:hypothetical protein n=1 Tax=Hominibacterium faecale TaxID=2839743 RepID=UPI0022B2922E|nr:hypothetical protein [Hominibacterium faecale]MCI7304487.1 hypothetical protein [Clostridia bacterium]MDY3013355.1 hypothetical protein [Clostridiales Family XIII bacterium]
MEIKIAIPLEIKRKKDLKKWIQIGYKCIALINKNSEEIKGKIISQGEKLLQISEKAYAIIWFFDDGMSQQHYAQLLNNATLILRRNDCLIYEITQISQISSLSTYWGEADSLDIVFPKPASEYRVLCEGVFYKNYNLYRKDFITRVLNAEAIIQDSGDGNEVQLILSEKSYTKLVNMPER